MKQIQELQEQVDIVLKTAPEGSLRCAVNKGSFQYYIGNQYQGKKKRQIVKRIAQKEYCGQLVKLLHKHWRAIGNLLELMENSPIESVYEQLHPARKELVEPYVKPIDVIMEEFENMTYERKGFGEEDTTAYYTNKGERVRSKSEKIIADALERRGIPYHYEMPLELRYKNRRIVMYPDFTVLNVRNGKVYILEHLGMMDKQSYYENALLKMDTYEKNGIMLGEKLIITHETAGSTLDTGVLDTYIEMYLQ